MNKAWHRRLNLIGPEEDKEEEEGGVAERDDPVDEQGGRQGLFEHDKQGEEQVLADVAEEEAVQVPQTGGEFTWCFLALFIVDNW